MIRFASFTKPAQAERRLATAVDSVAGSRLLADLSARLAVASADDIDATIARGLQQLAELFQIEHVMLWRRGVSDQGAIPTHSWSSHVDALAGATLALADSRSVTSKLDAGDSAWFARIDDVYDSRDREAFERAGLGSVAAVPMTPREPAAPSALGFASAGEYCWTPSVVEHLRVAAGMFSQALALQDALRASDRAGADGQGTHERAAAASAAKPNIELFRTTGLIVSRAESVRRALVQVEQVAPTPATVLLLGETGAGKEMFAQAIHELSPRRQRPMICVSCAAIPSALIESELFGRERGAYTGALSRQIGRFEAANHSTLFLDEIGELSPEVQVKLLRVLQERVIERLGSPQAIDVDVRIIAATNRNLEKAVQDEVFREDLYYRLNVFPITVPALRERVEDIPALAWQFARDFAGTFGRKIESISQESVRRLQLYSWPGNVRELRNVIERAVILATGPQLEVQIPQPSFARHVPAASTLKEVEVQHIRAVLEATRWRIRGPMGAAERLGLKPTTLETRLAQLGLKRPKVALDPDA